MQMVGIFTNLSALSSENTQDWFWKQPRRLAAREPTML